MMRILFRRPFATHATAAAVTLLFFMALPSIRAQDTLRPRYGIFGGYAINLHSADFQTLPQVPNCCPQFESGSGGGTLAGLMYGIPFSTWLLLEIRASYLQHNATLVEREPVTVIVNGTARDGAFEHSIDATLSTLGLEPSLRARLAGGLFAGIGLRGAAYLAHHYAQEERIVEPTDAGTFLDANGIDSRSRVRNQISGDIPEMTSLLLQGTVGLSYELRLNARGTVLLVPEISYAYSFSDVVQGLNWKPNGLRGSLALQFSPAPPLPKPVRYDTALVRDTVTRRSTSVTAPRIALQQRTANEIVSESADEIVRRTTVHESYLQELPAPPPMTCALAVAGVDDDGNEEPIATLRIEEFLSTVAHPLLNYIFFDPGSSQLPDRYTRLLPEDTATFRQETLFGAGTLDVYHTMLNIIGERMREHSHATLTLTGCNMDNGEEKGNLELSRKRAESVRDYLTSVWGIDSRRLQIEAMNLPTKRSNPLSPDGQAEDRRVEIASSIPEILDVLVAGDTTRTTSTPIVRLRPTINSAQGIASWHLTIAQHGATLKEFSGTGAPPAIIDWDPVIDRDHTPRFSEPIAVTINATNPEGEAVACGAAIDTRLLTIREKREQRMGDFTVDRYNLILFRVGESGITDANRRIISMVAARLKPESRLTIEGFADRSGSAASNQHLSALRAQATAQSLNRPDAVMRGVGESRLLYSNDTPEGRFYCRTVQITVKTPIGP